MPHLSDFDTQPHTHARGRAAESAAEAWLRRQGYRIVGRNYRSKVGEIDLVAYDGDILCFLEIKARRGRSFGSAAAQLTDRQRRRIVRAATLFVTETGYRGPCRFDVLGLDGTDDGDWEFTLLRGAFEA